MKSIDRDSIHFVINKEGFGYTFESHSEFKDIKDDEFHQLRKAYLEARKVLADYLGYQEID